jgi:hypothetical protein
LPIAQTPRCPRRCFPHAGYMYASQIITPPEKNPSSPSCCPKTCLGPHRDTPPIIPWPYFCLHASSRVSYVAKVIEISVLADEDVKSCLRCCTDGGFALFWLFACISLVIPQTPAPGLVPLTCLFIAVANLHRSAIVGLLGARILLVVAGPVGCGWKVGLRTQC